MMHVVYKIATSFTLIPALFDMVNALPSPLDDLPAIKVMIAFAD